MESQELHNESDGLGRSHSAARQFQLPVRPIKDDVSRSQGGRESQADLSRAGKDGHLPADCEHGSDEC